MTVEACTNYPPQRLSYSLHGSVFELAYLFLLCSPCNVSDEDEHFVFAKLGERIFDESHEKSQSAEVAAHNDEEQPVSPFSKSLHAPVSRGRIAHFPLQHLPTHFVCV